MAKTKPHSQGVSSLPASPLSNGTSEVQPLRPRACAAATPTRLFDPAATLIRMPELLALTGLHRATVYKRLKDDPTFPRPVPLSDSAARGAPVAWVLAEVQSWVRSRIDAREAAA